MMQHTTYTAKSVDGLQFELHMSDRRQRLLYGASWARSWDQASPHQSGRFPKAPIYSNPQFWSHANSQVEHMHAMPQHSPNGSHPVLPGHCYCAVAGAAISGAACYHTGALFYMIDIFYFYMIDFFPRATCEGLSFSRSSTGPEDVLPGRSWEIPPIPAGDPTNRKTCKNRKVFLGFSSLAQGPARPSPGMAPEPALGPHDGQRDPKGLAPEPALGQVGPHDGQRDPKGRPKGARGHPKGSQRVAQDSQRDPKGRLKGAQGHRKGSKRKPKVGHRCPQTAKGTRRVWRWGLRWVLSSPPDRPPAALGFVV